MNPQFSSKFLKILIFSILLSSPVVGAGLEAYVISQPIRIIACIFRTALIYIAGTLAALVFLIAGVKWVYSMEDPAKRKSARDSMEHAIIGLIIIGIADTVIMAIGQGLFTGCT